MEPSTGTCNLSSSTCDEGQPGRLLCTERNAKCLLTKDSPHGFVCECTTGKMFVNANSTVIDGEQLMDQPELSCIDLCEMPYEQGKCAAIGARCNQYRVHEQHTEISYCECVPGTFYSSSSKKCEQEDNSLLISLAFKWTHSLQKQLDDEILNLSKPVSDGQVVQYKDIR